MKIGNMRDMSEGELKKFIDEQRSQAVKLRFDIATRKTTDHREYRDARKAIARALTIVSERKKQSDK
jgi:ribosomal protein L29